jgi:hypothetical protein
LSEDEKKTCKEKVETISKMIYLCMKTTELFDIADEKMKNQKLIIKIIDVVRKIFDCIIFFLKKNFDTNVKKRYRDQIKDYENILSVIGKFIFIPYHGFNDVKSYFLIDKLPCLKKSIEITPKEEEDFFDASLKHKSSGQYTKLNKDEIYKEMEKSKKEIVNFKEQISKFFEYNYSKKSISSKEVCKS